MTRLAPLLLLAPLLGACDLLAPAAPPEDQVLDGTIAGMSPSQVGQHVSGDEEFGRVFAAADGLGPIFVAAGCEQCHVGDGKGHPVFSLVRFGRADGARVDPMLEAGGPQLQHRAIPGFVPETVPAEATYVTRLLPPSVSGLGYLDAVDDTTLAALADPDDRDGDGVSGRLQILEPGDLLERAVALEARSTPGARSRGLPREGGYVGRFGRKASTVNLLHQTVSAYQQDMGVTSDLLGEDLFNPAIGNGASDRVADPEVSGAAVADVVFYLKTLRAPSRRDASDPEVRAGEAVFASIGCATCHVPTLRTGRSEIAVLDRVEFHPYTDLLLHDMGPALDDGYSEGRALGSEWRTPPLWGLGVQASLQGGRAFYMHDGRAGTLPEAIELHGGEAAASREAFRRLAEPERRALIRFLLSL